MTGLLVVFVLFAFFGILMTMSYAPVESKLPRHKHKWETRGGRLICAGCGSIPRS